jgi:hypothetical protein
LMVVFHSEALPLLRSTAISYPLPLGVRHFVKLRSFPNSSGTGYY